MHILPEKQTHKERILFLINDLKFGGAQRVIYEIAHRLPQDRFDVQVWILKEAQGEFADLMGLFLQAGIRVESIGTGLSLRPGDIWRLAKRIRTYKPDIIHAHLPISVIAAALANFLAGKRAKVIAHEHNTYSLSPKKIAYARRMVSPLVALSICFTQGSEQEIFGSSKEYTLADNARLRRSWAIYNGADVQKVAAAVEHIDRDEKRKELGATAADVIVIGVARLISWKGHAQLIQAAALVKKDFANLRVVIVGSGPMEAELKTLISDLGLADVVTLLGSRGDVYELLGAADIYSGVYVYDERTASKESVGISGFEAMAAGLPIIVADYPSAATFIKAGETGVAVEPGNPAALAVAIETLARDPQKRKDIGRQAAALARERLSWERIARLYEKIYNDLAV